MQTSLRTIGIITAPHGIKGAVFIRPSDSQPGWVGKLKRIFLLEKGVSRPLEVTSSRFQNKKVIIQFKDIGDRNLAETLRGLIVQVPEDQLPALGKDEYYADSLAGLTVQSMDTGKTLGTVQELLSSSAGEFLEIMVANQKEPVLVPFQTVFVPKVDLENKLILLKGLDSLFEGDA